MRYTNEQIDKILKSNPPVYNSGIYFTVMAKRLCISEQAVKNKCVQLGLINILKRK